MKKVILTFLFAGAFVASQAQTEKGTWMLGGNIGFSTSSSTSKSNGTTVDGPSYTNFNISPMAGYFIMDRLAVGLDLNYSSFSSTTKQKNTAGNNVDLTDKSSDIIVSPMVRYYYMMNDKAGLFGHLGVGFGSRSSSNQSLVNDAVTTTESPSSSLFNLTVGPGFVYFLNPSIGLEASVLYSSMSSSYTPTGASDKVTNASSGVSVNIGFGIYLGSK